MSRRVARHSCLTLLFSLFPNIDWNERSIWLLDVCCSSAPILLKMSQALTFVEQPRVTLGVAESSFILFVKHMFRQCASWSLWHSDYGYINRPIRESIALVFLQAKMALRAGWYITNMPKKTIHEPW